METEDNGNRRCWWKAFFLVLLSVSRLAFLRAIFDYTEEARTAIAVVLGETRHSTPGTTAIEILRLAFVDCSPK